MYCRSALLTLLLPACLVAAPSPENSKRLSATDLAGRVDAAVDAKIRTENVRAANRAEDGEFLRRVYLDLTGHIPSVAKAVAFLDDHRADKRARVIDELLASPEYGKHMADIWLALLVNRNSDNRQVTFDPLRTWLEKEFNGNKSWDSLVRDLITATGSPEENGATTYFLANQSIDKVTDNVTKMFLGVQLQCAQCHNHPFNGWKQTEYWGMAAFFFKLQAQPPRPMMMQKSEAGMVREFDFVRGKRALPESAKMVPAKFLGGSEPQVQPRDPMRPVLAQWLTAADNPYFAKAMVNRTWAQLFGRGFVNPIDDMNDANSPSHPELLNQLAKQFAQNNFDLKFLFRTLCNTRAYQRTSKGAGMGEVAPELFARMSVKVLSPEQLFDSMTLVLANPAAQAAAREVQVNKPGNQLKKEEKVQQRNPEFNPRSLFVAFFKVEDADPTEYQAGIPQALRLMNGPQFNGAINNSPLVRGNKPVPQAVQDLYLATLARRPTAQEQQRSAAYVAKQKDPKAALSDLLWALLNSSEFSMNH